MNKEFMDLYQKWTDCVATYPKDDKRPVYPCMGLMGESGELIDKLKKIIRGDDPDEEGIKKEIGDVLWYVARFCEDSGLKMSDYWGIRTVRSYFGENQNFFLSTGLMKHVSKLCDRAWLESDTNQYLSIISECIGGILGVLTRLCENFDYTIEDAMRNNMDKLESRKKRGTIQGSGDER